MSSSSAAGGNRMDIIPFLIRATPDPCTKESDGPLSIVGTEEQAKHSVKAPPVPTFTVLHASYTFLPHRDLLSLLGSVL